MIKESVWRVILIHGRMQFKAYFVCAFATRVEQFVQIMIKTFAHLKTNVVQPIWLLQHNHDEQFCPSCFEILKTSVVQSILLLRLNQY